MGKVPRVDVADLVYHAYNRGNAGSQLFFCDKDYLAFENVIEEAKIKAEIRILAYCIMPNHWHFVLYPEKDSQLQVFFHWLTLTHTQRWQVVRNFVGHGHVYQGRYKSNICENNEHFLNLVRYVERNAVRANLVERAEDWRWSSVWRRENGTEKQKQLLSEWPVPVPQNYLETLIKFENSDDLDELRRCLKRGRPYGSGEWTVEMVREHGLEASVRSRGGYRRL
jgi:putative transposase